MTGVDAVRQAAVSLFARQGYAGTGIRELGRAVGLTSATLYHYAGAKEDLLAGVMRDALAELLRSARDAVDGPGVPDGPAVQLARLVAVHVGFSAVNPQTTRVTDHEVRALSPATRAELVGMRDDYEAMFARVLDRGARTAVFALTDVRLARLGLLGMCNGVANWYQSGGRVDLETLQERFIEFTCRMVGTPVLHLADLGPLAPPVRLACEPPTSTTSREESA
ncbi:TetR/AcrR family transcriptional regulator [Virgisporangium ochraceum]|uniref:TetR family transcriptional regulator n=1 Tax=Virgisporangium ochraceum TaxID=65505 RepID=A0A8J4A3X5_9ACTN|nr:TetR/AcrR family transcriptional regulator [Virgisporangium ochraceum]GIJ73778.1 TetR family transcriptional regulator [Virgisporangium ochraceum]